MSIIISLMDSGRDKFVIPSPSRMFWSSVSKTDRVLCFYLSRGYFELDNVETLKDVLAEVEQRPDMKLVGDIDAVTVGKITVFRQRVFFMNLGLLLNLCKLRGIYVELHEDFRVSINSVMSVVEELPRMEFYASEYGETIDDWLTHCLKIHFHNLLKNEGMITNLETEVSRFLSNKVGYMDRAPFMAASFDKKGKRSSIFLQLDMDSKKLFSDVIQDKLDITYGYTLKNITEDAKRGKYESKFNKTSPVAG